MVVRMAQAIGPKIIARVFFKILARFYTCPANDQYLLASTVYLRPLYASVFVVAAETGAQAAVYKIRFSFANKNLAPN